MRSLRFLMVPVAACALALGACTAEVEEEGKAPEVNVEGGEAPEVDVDPAKVDVPDVDVSRDSLKVPVPDVDVKTSPADTSR